MRWEYSISGDELRVEDTLTGGPVWQGKPDGVPVRKLLPLAGSDDCVVLLDYYHHSKSPRRGSGNLIRCGHDGSVLWRAALPQSSDAYVDAELSDRGLIAHSWAGYQVVIDSETGDILTAEFTK